MPAPSTCELSLLPFEEIKKVATIGQPIASLTHPTHAARAYRTRFGRSRARATGGRGTAGQWQREQRGGVAVRAGARVWQQSSGPAFPLHRRLRLDARDVGAGRAAVFVCRCVRAEARLHRLAVCGVVRRAVQDSRREKPPGILCRLSTQHRSQRSCPIGHHADGPDALGRFLGPARDSRSGDGRGFSGQRDSRLAHQPPGIGAPRPVSRAERRRWRCVQLRANDRVDHQSRHLPVAPESRRDEPRFAPLHRDISAHRQQGDDRLRTGRRGRDVESRRVAQLVAPVQPVFHRADRLPVSATDERHHAALRQSREHLRRGGHQRQQSGARQLGTAQPDVCERHRRCGHGSVSAPERAGSRGLYRGTVANQRAATTSRLARACARKPST